SEMGRILTSLTRELAFDVLSNGHGEERGVPISFQVQSPVVGLVLPSNSPGVHTLWLPIIPLQVGLVLKPGPQEPWTPYRMADAISKAIDADVQTPGVTEVTAKYRDGSRLVKQGRAEYLLPTVIHCESPEAAVTKKEYMFPFVTVVQCPEAKMLDAIGPTLVCS